MEAIEEHIIRGYKNGYFENMYLNTQGGDFQSQATEYLFTVNIAQQLLGWRSSLAQNYRYSIRFEYSASEFKNNCFLAFRIERPEDIFARSKMIYRQSHVPVRNESGRIDIAILETPWNVMSLYPLSVIGIEVKGISPSFEKVVDDIVRLIDCVNAEDPIGVNNLKSCFVVYGRRIDRPSKPFSEAEFRAKWEELESSVKKDLDDIPQMKEVDYSLHLFEIDKTTAEEFSRVNRDDEGLVDYHEAAAGTGAIAGILVWIRKKVLVED